MDNIQDIAWFVRVHPLPHLGRWKWKCKGDTWATNEEVNCFAHAPEPKAGECNLSEVNKCRVGTVEETSKPLTNGTRWNCVWVDGGDSTTCSTCDDGYRYNSTTSKCEPKCGAGYTLHNGHCVKWKCETIPGSTTPGQCSGTYQKPTWKYYYEGEKTYGECVGRNGHERLVVWNECCFDQDNRGHWAHSSQCQWAIWTFYDPTLDDVRYKPPGRKLEHAYGYRPCLPSQDGKSYDCRYSCTKDPEKYPRFCVKKERESSESCSSLNQTECGSKSWCTWTLWTTTPATIKTVCEEEWKWVVSDWMCGNLQKMSCTGEWKCEMRSSEWVCQSASLPWWRTSGGPDSCNKNKSQVSCDRDPDCTWLDFPWKKNVPVCKDSAGNDLPASACTGTKTCLNPVNGQCQTYAWTHASQPATSRTNGCLAGDYLDDADTNTYWQRKCKGRDWGSEEICKAPKKIDGKCWSSYMTCQAWTPSNWSEETRGGRCYKITKFRWECWWIGGGRQDSCFDEDSDSESWC